ncbi:MAG TPA: hypothetical protein VHY56_05805, partial [Candidatus Binataceae bacterium]|nr:hypothetical protein [Candidatus Binataceae bacterium]
MKILIVLLTAAVIGCVANSIAWASQNDLGSANQFGVLSFGGTVQFNQVSELEAAYVSTPPSSCPGQVGCTPDTGAVNIGLSFQDYLAGDAIASRSKGIAIFMGPKNIAGGQCVTGGGGVVLSASSVCEGGIDQGGSNSKVTTLLPTADIDAVAFSTTLSGLAATQILGAIALTSGQSYTITTSSGLNVIDLPSIVTQGYNTIT